MRMSENEYMIMELLWKEGRPLSRAEILKGTPNKNWNPASVHLILNAMISKGTIRITDEQKKYGRTYEACFTQDEFIMNGLKELLPNGTEKELLNAVLDAFAIKNGKVSKAVLKDIQKYIDDKTDKTKKKGVQ